MNVLVACEESQVVCLAFRAKGHNAFSCDLQEPSGGHPEYHILGDVTPLLNGRCTFETMDGTQHSISGSWDLIIAHPPCTHLCAAGQRWFSENRKPIRLQREAFAFFYKFVLADCAHIAIENPVGIMSTCFRKPDQIYNPYDFQGETECKKTCLWLRGLEPLKPTQFLPKELRTHGIYNAQFDGKQYSWNDPQTAVLRSRTPLGVARAMADQWSCL